MVSQLQIAADGNDFAPKGPRHIGAILPQVLARYKIVVPPEKLAISSARLRRRFAGALATKSSSRRPYRRPAAIATVA